MHKKAQGLSLNTIVVAAIVLIVLIVLVGIFTGYFSKFVPSLTGAGEQTCTANGLEPRPEAGGCFDGETRVYGNFGDDFEDKICCRSIAESTTDLTTDPTAECTVNENCCSKASGNNQCAFCEKGGRCDLSSCRSPPLTPCSSTELNCGCPIP